MAIKENGWFFVTGLGLWLDPPRYILLRNGRRLLGRPPDPESQHRRQQQHQGHDFQANRGQGTERPAHQGFNPRRSALPRSECDNRPDGGRYKGFQKRSRRRVLRHQRGQRRRGRRETASGQATPQQITRPRQPSLHRSRGPTKLASRLLVGLSLQIAQDKRYPVFLRQAKQLGIEHVTQFQAVRLGEWSVSSPFSRLPFASPTPGGVGTGVQGGSVGHFVEPARHRIAPGKRDRPAREQEEGCLEDVLGLMPVEQQAPRQALYHRPVAPDQGFKGGFRAVQDELLQQLPIRRFGDGRRAQQCAQVPHVGRQGSLGHDQILFRGSRRNHGNLPLSWREGGPMVTLFLENRWCRALAACAGVTSGDPDEPGRSGLAEPDSSPAAPGPCGE